ncbi:LytTR family transcriptional regulator [Ruminococcaceae bacterium OttesenSCG-928-A16]|nr:LytTR family transcriptional regulator [Ruminococcaceae bacterium OttesenSCG-928-A16]
MKVEIVLNQTITEPLLVLHTNKLTPELAALMANLAEPQSLGLAAYTKTGIVLLNPADILRVYSEGKRVFTKTATNCYLLKMRLYEAEEKLGGNQMVRISSSEIVNFNHVKGLDMSISGTIRLSFNNGEETFVSRRYVSVIKKLLGV